MFVAHVVCELSGFPENLPARAVKHGCIWAGAGVVNTRSILSHKPLYNLDGLALKALTQKEWDQRCLGIVWVLKLEVQRLRTVAFYPPGMIKVGTTLDSGIRAELPL